MEEEEDREMRVRDCERKVFRNRENEKMIKRLSKEKVIKCFEIDIETNNHIV